MLYSRKRETKPRIKGRHLNELLLTEMAVNYFAANSILPGRSRGNHKSRQRLDRHGTIVSGSFATSRHCNVQGSTANDEQ